jgi:AraC-like DNA-binding protein
MSSDILKSEKRTESRLELKEIFSGNIPFCDPQLNVARWVAVIHNSGFYLREFCASLPFTPRELIETVRLAQAIYAIPSSDKKLAQIGHEVGFANPQTFRRAVLRRTGLSPTQLAAQLRTGGIAPEVLVRQLWRNDELYRLFREYCSAI